MAPGMRRNVSNMTPYMSMRDKVSIPNVKHWSLENGYENGSNKREYPIRIFNSGRRSSLYLSLAIPGYEYEHRCSGKDHGFKVILTQPGEVLKMSRNVFRVPLTEDNIISIEPKLITTSEGLRHYPPDERKCFYQSERSLRFFKMYTQSNCEEECLANFTKIKCGCVKFSMPSMNAIIATIQ